MHQAWFKTAQRQSVCVYSPRTRKSTLTASEYCSLIHSDASTLRALLTALACEGYNLLWGPTALSWTDTYLCACVTKTFDEDKEFTCISCEQDERRRNISGARGKLLTWKHTRVCRIASKIKKKKKIILKQYEKYNNISLHQENAFVIKKKKNYIAQRLCVKDENF